MPSKKVRNAIPRRGHGLTCKFNSVQESCVSDFVPAGNVKVCFLSSTCFRQNCAAKKRIKCLQALLSVKYKYLLHISLALIRFIEIAEVVIPFNLLHEFTRLDSSLVRQKSNV